MNDQPLPFEAMFYKAQNEIAALRATVTALEKERDELKTLLAHKNETANTFMEQVKKLQSKLTALEKRNAELEQMFSKLKKQLPNLDRLLLPDPGTPKAVPPKEGWPEVEPPDTSESWKNQL